MDDKVLKQLQHKTRKGKRTVGQSHFKASPL